MTEKKSWIVERFVTVDSVVDELGVILESGPVNVELWDALKVIADNQVDVTRIYDVIAEYEKRYIEPLGADDSEPETVTKPTAIVELPPTVRITTAPVTPVAVEPKEEPSPKPARQRSKRVRESEETLADREVVRQAYVEAFTYRYGIEPMATTSAFFRTQVKRIHTELGTATAIKAIRAYLAWENPYEVRLTHPIARVLQNLNSLRVDLHNPDAKYEAIARGRAQEKARTEELTRDGVANELLQRDERFSRLSEGPTRNAIGSSRSNVFSDGRSEELSHANEGGIPQERDLLFNRDLETEPHSDTSSFD